ncbi:predicted protein [Postia placenta Mad-698-R]|nr:predicted protein [Postia placenta Mad-698-R]
MSSSRAGGRATSPTSQLLKSMNMTREDLRRHSEQMRQFLTTEQANEGRNFAPVPNGHRSKSSVSRSRGRSRAGSSADASVFARSPSPPQTPVKAEPIESTLPTRPLDTMELVMERKLNEKLRRSRYFHPATIYKFIYDLQTPVRTHDASSNMFHLPLRVASHPRYYSSRVVNEALSSQPYLPPFDAANGALPRTPLGLPPSRGADSNSARRSFGRHIYSTPRTAAHTPTPASSPPRVINQVSSPAPMRSSPAPEEHDELPFILPPGPYCAAKPEFAYAGLIGQAILASPQHRLTLQDIYEFITIVYPYYKRGEQTWMNSVRHCLSTMAVFRKVPRGRNEGKSLWAIFDDDVAAFVGGGFRKTLCKDMVKLDQEKAAKKGPRKRGTMDEVMTRDTKRRKKNDGAESNQASSSALPVHHGPVFPPYFPGFHPSAHHQPYYQPYVPLPRPQPLPAEVVFPPLPPTSNLHRVAHARTPGQVVTSPALESDDVSRTERGRNPSPKPISSSPSAPSLTPNFSSSSSPPLPSDASLEAQWLRSPSASPQAVESADEDFGTSWTSKLTYPVDALDPQLLNKQGPSHSQKPAKGKGKGKAQACFPRHFCSLYSSSHLDPPLPAVFHPAAPLLAMPIEGLSTSPTATFSGEARTPTRRRDGPSSSMTGEMLPLTPFAPTTPRRTKRNTFESPFRTPTNKIYDPVAPGALLAEELERQERQQFDVSPGIFGRRERLGSLFDTPTGPSPGAWDRLW